jgi:GNAT superfamily N-acetyltransferase
MTPAGAITIRPMQDRDREAVVDLLWQLNLYEKRLSDTRSERREDAEACLAWNDERIQEGGAHCVAEIDSRIVAYLCLVIQMAPPFIRAEFRRHLYVADLVVDESWRGRGIGRAMLAEADAYARDQRLGHILIGLTAGNTRADRLYASEGYAFYGVERLKTLG